MKWACVFVIFMLFQRDCWMLALEVGHSFWIFFLVEKSEFVVHVLRCLSQLDFCHPQRAKLAWPIFSYCRI